MYFDYIVLGLMAWGIADSFLWTDTSDAEEDDTDTTDPDQPDLDLMGDETEGEDTPDDDSNDDVGGDDALGEEDDQGDELAEGDETGFVPRPTTITITDDQGEARDTVFDGAQFDTAPTLSGSDGRDLFEASDDTGFELILEAGGGNDNMEFGYGASVDPGDGSDRLFLNVTQNALLSENEHGTVNLTDPDDALSITFEDDTSEFLHAVRGSSVTPSDAGPVRVTWIDYYVSDQEQLPGSAFIDGGTYDSESATRVVRVIVGENATTAEAPQINSDPTIVFNRTVASEITA